MDANLNKKPTRKIARRLILATILFSSLITLISTAIQLYRDYRRDLSLIDSQLAQIQEVHLPSIAGSLWLLDDKGLQVLVDGMLQLPDILYLEVSDGERIWAKSGGEQADNVITRQFPLRYEHLGDEREIGILTAVATLDKVYQRLFDKAVDILVSNAIKTFLVAGFMLLLFYFLVTRHLVEIAGFLRNQDLEEAGESLRLSHKIRNHPEPDELDLVVDELNTMRATLQRSYDTLKKSESRVRVLFFLLLTSSSTHVAANSAMTISLVEDPWPPYIEGEIGEHASGGKLVDLYREVFKRIEGVEVQYLLMPWKRALVEVELGRHDGIMALFKSPERAEVMDFTAPIFTGRTMLWYAQGKYPAPLDWDTMDDLTRYNIVVLRGSAMADPLREAVDRGVPLSIIEVNSHQQQFEMVLRGRADIAPLTEVVGYHLLEQEGLKGEMVPMNKPLSSGDVYYMAFSKKSPARALIPRINGILDDMDKQGLIFRFLLGKQGAE